MADFSDVRLHVVTGKGGTGKTTVASALALALAADGRKVLLAEVEARQGLARLFDCSPLTYDERAIARAPRGGHVHGIAIDPEEALLEYLYLFYKFPRNGMPARTVRRLGAIEFATTIAPGMQDVLLTGKVKEAVVRLQRDGRPTYDAVVLDAPPTGRVARFLNISHEVSGLARVGPIKNQADGVMAVLRSPRTAVHIVTVLEEMPVQETLDAAAELRTLGLPVGGVVVNGVRSPLLAPADLDAARRGALDLPQLTADLKDAGLQADDAVVGALAAEAQQHARRLQLEERQRDVLAAVGRPTYDLPMLTHAVDLGALHAFAGALHEQGMV
ncbi:MAG TPA: ArsA-related P-loop ATPase [Mycobacteriales bacterium]|nr:ArsA-related P-loop ATPase [Mycobacteriales bacterium]